jgi:hypothetical protein
MLDAAKHTGQSHDEAIAAIIGLYRSYWAEWDQFAQLRQGSHHLALAA